MVQPVRDRMKYMRYGMVIALIAGSAIPSIILAPILGDINLLFLLVLWPLFLLSSRVLRKRLTILVSVFFASAMTIPPVPNYVSASSQRFSFIGFENIFGGELWRLAFFFILYVSIFIAAAFLTKSMD